MPDLLNLIMPLMAMRTHMLQGVKMQHENLVLMNCSITKNEMMLWI